MPLENLFQCLFWKGFYISSKSHSRHSSFQSYRCCCAQDLFSAQQELVCCSRTPSRDLLPVVLIKPVTFCLQDTVFNHQAQPATSQHGQIPQTAHFTTAAQTAGIYSWWARSVGAHSLIYVKSHTHALAGVNSEASHSRSSCSHSIVWREKVTGAEGQWLQIKHN